MYFCRRFQFLWLSSFNASGKEELRRALKETECDINEDICVMGIFYGHAKSLSCRATDQLPNISCDSLLPRHKSYLLRKIGHPMRKRLIRHLLDTYLYN